MLDSERTFKIKLRSSRMVFKNSITSAVICIQRVLDGDDIIQNLHYYKRHELDKSHSTKLLQSSTSYI